MKGSKLLGIILIACLVLAFAAGIVSAETVKVYPDVPVGHWAEKDIAKMKFKGVVSGYSDGYHPDEAINREQAVVMLLRVVGLNEGAPSQSLEQLVESSAVTPWYEYVSPWAERPLAIAVENGVLIPDDERNFRPKEKIKRYELAVFSARAMGLTEEAQSAYGSRLNFTDAGQIPGWAVGYVKSVVQREIVTGYPDNTFRPNDPVTRAQMASILARIDEQMGNPTGNVVRGEVLSQGAENLLRIIDRSGSERTFKVAPDAFICDGRYQSSGRLPLSALMEGHKVELILDSDGDAVYVEIVPDDAFVTGEELEGIITGISSFERVLTLLCNDEIVSYAVTPEARIKVNGFTAGLGDLSGGQRVTATVREGKIVAVAAEDAHWNFEGIVEQVAGYGGEMSVTVRDNGGNKLIFTIDSSTGIEVEGSEAGPSDLKKGQSVRIRAYNLTARSIEAEDTHRVVEGRVISTAFSPRWSITILNEDGVKETFEVDARCDIEKNDSEVGFADIAAGDIVKLRVENNLVTDLEAESEENENEGVIKEITFGLNVSKITIEDKNGNEYSYEITSETEIRKDRKRAELKDVNAGDHAELEIEGGRVTRMDIESRTVRDYVVGEVVNISERASVIVIEPDMSDREIMQINVTNDTYLIKSGKSIDLDDIEEGDHIIAVGDAEEGVFIASEIVVTSNSE